MKKLSLLILLFFILATQVTQAQQKFKISGKVLDEKTNEPLPFVSVYINTTTTGTTTNQAGDFTLELGPGKYQLVVSFTGYEPIIRELNVLSAPEPFLFKLKTKAQELQEVAVTAKRDKNWAANLEVFKTEFLGSSSISRKCKILNPEVLQLTFTPETNILQAKARDFLQIENPELGYRIKYLLVHFQYDVKKGFVTFLGYPSYELMPGNNAKQKQWAENRQQTYNGSVMHFVRTLRAQKLVEEGFYLRKIFLETARGSRQTITRIDTAAVPYSEYLTTTGKDIVMTFPGYFYVSYNRKLEDKYYNKSKNNATAKPGRPKSVIQLLDKSVILEPQGTFTKPLGIFFDGYWGWEKTGDILPLDYKSEEIIPTPPQDPQLTAIIQPLHTFKITHPQEKIYLHVDKPYYIAGEDIWYKAYLLNSSNHTLDSLSNQVYVELISPQGKVVDKQIIKIDVGTGAGDFDTSDILEEGTYTLRAYTNWMRNLPDDFFFKQEIKIYNDIVVTPPAPTATKTDPKKAELASKPEQGPPKPSGPPVVINFYPESGNLVNGLESKVGFKAINWQGKSENISGVLVDEKGEQLVAFTSTHAGMGQFTFTPQAGKTYTARVKTVTAGTITLPLPTPLETGILLAVNNLQPDNIRLNIRHNKNAAPAKLALVGQVRGQVYYATTVSFTNTQPINLVVPRQKFPTGVVHFTLLDAATREPIAERLCFNNSKDQLVVQVKSNKAQYQKREKVELEITTTDSEGNPAATDLSLAAVDGALKLGTYNQNMSTYLLFASDLKGTIEQPGYYFKDENTATRLALDNLMLTQGWRRFIWKEIITGQLPKPTFEAEKGLAFTGQVFRLGTTKPASNTDVLVSVLSKEKGNKFVPFKTDEAGRFQVNNLHFDGLTDILVQGENQKGKPFVTVKIDDPKPPVFTSPYLNPVPPFKTAEELAYLKRVKEKLKQDDRYEYAKDGSRVLKEVKITGRAEPDFIASTKSRADKIIKLDQLSPDFSGDLIQAIRTQMPSLMYYHKPVIGPDGSTEIVRELKYRSGGNNVIATLNGQQIDLDILALVSPEDVESVFIYRNTTSTITLSSTDLLTPTGPIDVMAVYLKKGASGWSRPKEGVTYKKMNGYYAAREFYAPSYDIRRPDHTLPDKRSTLYWNPFIRTDAFGKALVSFYNGDDTTKMNITVEGISATGLVGSQMVTIGK